MPEPDESFKTDLRDIVEARLGKPLAASVLASLWRCPVCSPETHSLLMVSADECRCLGRLVCDGGTSAWIPCIVDRLDEQALSGIGL